MGPVRFNETKNSEMYVLMNLLNSSVTLARGTFMTLPGRPLGGLRGQPALKPFCFVIIKRPPAQINAFVDFTCPESMIWLSPSLAQARGTFATLALCIRISGCLAGWPASSPRGL